MGESGSPDREWREEGGGGGRWWTLQQGGRNVFLETLLGHFWNRKWEISGECVYERRRSISVRREEVEGGSEENQLVPLEWAGTHARTHLLSFLSRSSFMWFKCYCTNNVFDCDVKREMLWWLAGCVSSLNYKPLNVKFTLMGRLCSLTMHRFLHAISQSYYFTKIIIGLF